MQRSGTCEEVRTSASSAELPLLSSSDPLKEPAIEPLVDACTDSAASAMSSSSYRRIRAACMTAPSARKLPPTKCCHAGPLSTESGVANPLLTDPAVDTTPSSSGASGTRQSFCCSPRRCNAGLYNLLHMYARRNRLQCRVSAWSPANVNEACRAAPWAEAAMAQPWHCPGRPPAAAQSLCCSRWCCVVGDSASARGQGLRDGSTPQQMF